MDRFLDQWEDWLTPITTEHYHHFYRSYNQWANWLVVAVMLAALVVDWELAMLTFAALATFIFIEASWNWEVFLRASKSFQGRLCFVLGFSALFAWFQWIQQIVPLDRLQAIFIVSTSVTFWLMCVCYCIIRPLFSVPSASSLSCTSWAAVSSALSSMPCAAPATRGRQRALGRRIPSTCLQHLSNGLHSIPIETPSRLGKLPCPTSIHAIAMRLLRPSWILSSVEVSPIYLWMKCCFMLSK